MLKWTPLLPYPIPKLNQRHVIRNVRKFLDSALSGDVFVEAVGSRGITITSSTTDADLVFVVLADQLPLTPCIMLIASRGTEESAKTILDLKVLADGGGGDADVSSQVSEASTYASEALDYASSATLSASAAVISASEAGSYADAASTFASESASSVISIGTSVSDASTYASNASDSGDTASTSASDAADDANEASTSASNASDSETVASTSVTAASTDNASTSRVMLLMTLPLRLQVPQRVQVLRQVLQLSPIQR